jgi:predicted transcriptional regulator
MPKVRTKAVLKNYTTTTIKIELKIFQQVQKIAETKGLSNSLVIEQAIREYIKSLITN